MFTYELNHLKYFYYTVKAGGVSPAAKLLNVQQPVVSKTLSYLEDCLKKELFWKKGRHKVLTDYGQALFRQCMPVFENLENIDAFISEQEKIPGIFNIGASEPIVANFIPDTIVDLRKEFPKLVINVHSGTASYLCDKIVASKIDMGLFFHMPHYDHELEVIKRVPHTFVIVIAKGQKKNKRIIENFIGSREIDNSDNAKFPTLNFIKEKFPNVNIKLSSNNLEFHRKMVLAGQGVSILPLKLVQEDISLQKLDILYPRKKFIFHLKLVRKTGYTRTKVTNFFEELF